MARLEARMPDLGSWPGLAVPPTSVGSRTAVAQALRRSVRDLDLRIDFPDDSASGEFDASRRIVLIRPEDFWSRLVAAGVTGLGESYMAGDWLTEDLAEVLRVLLPWVAEAPDCGHPGERTAGRERAERPGRRHRHRAVDLDDGLPGDLAALFTDETMSTSGAVFASGSRTRRTLRDGTEEVLLEAPTAAPHRTDLGDAQRRAADMVLDLAGVGPGSRVAVIPPGWGELPLRGAERGARVRTATTSTERLAMLGSRFTAAGVRESIALSLAGPEELGGGVDALVAVEPGGVFGASTVPAVLDAAGRLLQPGGRVVLQTLVSTGRSTSALREAVTWQDRYVGTASAPPTWDRLLERVHRVPGLRVAGHVDLSAHHAETVRLWSETFAVRGRDAAALGFDPVFRRMWAFALAVPEAALRGRWVESIQVLAVLR